MYIYLRYMRCQVACRMVLTFEDFNQKPRRSCWQTSRVSADDGMTWISVAAGLFGKCV